MKKPGTLKIEIIKPLSTDWDDAAPRMRALTSTLVPALNVTMRDLYPDAMGQIQAKRSGEPLDQQWQTRARALLREKWTQELARRFAYDQAEFSRGKRKKNPVARSFLPVVSEMAGETVNLLLLARFTGEHLRDLLASRSSIPSWSGNQAIYSEGRSCHISGSASEARLRFPLWGTGLRGACEFAVKPAGGSARALWRKLVRDFARRSEIVDLERAVKEATKIAAQHRKRVRELEKMDPAPQQEIEREREAMRIAEESGLRAELSLEQSGTIKMGRVGLKYDRKRDKWFFLISWTEYRVAPQPGEGQTAAVNYGINIFAQAMAEDGTTWEDSGLDIRVTRSRFGARRRAIQRSLRRLGRGSRGHGKKRRYLPITKLEHAEHNWMQTRTRQHAADLATWCADHRVTRLVLHDLSGQREAFEKKTGGEAHEQMKRFIHSWPFYETLAAVQRQVADCGITVELIKPGGESTRCPECGHEDTANVKLVDYGGQYLIHEGAVYRSVERFTRFECAVCGTKGKGDVVTCAGMLLAVGAKNPLGKMQEAARKRAVSGIKTEARRKK